MQLTVTHTLWCRLKEERGPWPQYSDDEIEAFTRVLRSERVNCRV